jgi:hypothetical protein
MTNRSLLVLCASFALVTSAPQIARAATPFTLYFSGIVDEQTTDPNGKLAAAGIGVGSPIQGYLTYDTSATYLYDLNLGPGVYNAYYPAILAFHFTVNTPSGAYEFGFNDGAIPAGALISDFIYPSYHQIEAGVSGNGFAPETPIAPTTPAGYTQNWTVQLYLNDSTASALKNTDSLPAGLTPAQWDTRTVVFSSFAEQGANNVADYSIHAAIGFPPGAPALPRPYVLLAASLLALLATLAFRRRAASPGGD